MLRYIVCWALIAIFTIGGLTSISVVGKPRKPLAHGAAVSIVVFDALLVLSMVYLLRSF